MKKKEIEEKLNRLIRECLELSRNYDALYLKIFQLEHAIKETDTKENSIRKGKREVLWQVAKKHFENGKQVWRYCDTNEKWGWVQKIQLEKNSSAPIVYWYKADEIYLSKEKVFFDCGWYEWFIEEE